MGTLRTARSRSEFERSVGISAKSVGVNPLPAQRVGSGYLTGPRSSVHSATTIAPRGSRDALCFGRIPIRPRGIVGRQRRVGHAAAKSS